MKKFFITESDRNQIKSLYQTKGLLNEEYGTINYDDGSEYTGEYRGEDGHRIRDGYGSTVWPDGDKYEGDWKDDKKNGYGTYVWTDGSKYEGYWKDDKRDGYATSVYSDGSKYEGYWKDDKKNGYGTLTYHDGTVEQGNWVDGEFQGAEESSEESEEESIEDCEELRVSATAESLYNICNLQSGKVVIGLRNQGPLVKYIQCILNQQEDELAELVLDGIFGPKTKEKVEKFQQNNEGLTVDGIVGEKTFEKFNLSPVC